MLHGDRAERRERGRLLQHALGEVRVQPHPLPLAGAERPRLVPDRVRDAEPPEVVRRAPARRSVRTSSASQPELRARRRRRARRPPAQCPSVYGDLRSTKSAIASARASNSSPRERDRRARARRRSPPPRSRSSSSPANISLGVLAEARGQLRVELLAGRACGASAPAAPTPPTRCATSMYSASWMTRAGQRDLRRQPARPANPCHPIARRTLRRARAPRRRARVGGQELRDRGVCA